MKPVAATPRRGVERPASAPPITARHQRVVLRAPPPPSLARAPAEPRGAAATPRRAPRKRATEALPPPPCARSGEVRPRKRAHGGRYPPWNGLSSARRAPARSPSNSRPSSAAPHILAEAVRFAGGLSARPRTSAGSIAQPPAARGARLRRRSRRRRASAPPPPPARTGPAQLARPAGRAATAPCGGSARRKRRLLRRPAKPPAPSCEGAHERLAGRCRVPRAAAACHQELRLEARDGERRLLRRR